MPDVVFSIKTNVALPFDSEVPSGVKRHFVFPGLLFFRMKLCSPASLFCYRPTSFWKCTFTTVLL